MKALRVWGIVSGFVLHILIGGLLMLSGTGKLFGFMPQTLLDKLRGYGLGEEARLIGTGELVSGLLLLLPWTMPVGTVLASAFWGGVICILMSHEEDYMFSSIVLLMTWVGAWLRRPELLYLNAQPSLRADRPEPDRLLSSTEAPL